MPRFRALLLLAVVAACGDGTSSGSPRVVVAPILDSLFVGDTVPPGGFAVTYLNAAGDTQPTGPVSWTGSNAAVFTVDPATGRVVATGRGEAVLSATANGITGSALIVVARPLQVDLLLDTINLLPGDTFTLPVSVLAKTGPAPQPWFSPSPNAAIYTVDSATGLVTAVSAGAPVRFIVHADTVADSGAVVVRQLFDTTGGRAYFTVLGTVIRRTSAEAKATNYKRAGDTLTFRFNAGLPTLANAVENVVITLRTAVTAPGTFVIDSLSLREAFGAGTDAVCLPARNWGLWSTRTTNPTVSALSRQAGTITITTIDTTPGGIVTVSGRFLFSAQRADLYTNPLGLLPVRGTFVAALVTDLRPCRS